MRFGNPFEKIGNPFKKEKKNGQVAVANITPVNVDEVLETYWIQEPFSKVNIGMQDHSEKSLFYVVEEVQLDQVGSEAYHRLASLLEKEMNPPKSHEVDPSQYVMDEAKRLSKKYAKSFKKVSPDGWEKVFYYIDRNMVGYGDLDTLIKDPRIEDISCNGVNKPIYVWHQDHEGIPTNVVFKNETDYNNLIIKLAHMSGKHISSAYPVLDAMLPEKHRLAATFMREVSSFGSSFTIRKFRERPFSIVDLIKLGTIDAELAAYFWLLLENKLSFMIVGGTGAGKTSMLNALGSLIMPNDKIVTVEEVNELNFYHENWVQLVSRRGFKFGESDSNAISLFDLVKLSLRYRPEYIVVGEVRGEEAYVLFQAMATGHGGLCTMHADSLDHAIKRLTSPPMSVSEVYIPLMNVCIYTSRSEIPRDENERDFGRRIRTVSEIVDFDKYQSISNWSPTTDSFKTTLNKSVILDRIASMKGLTKNDMLEEVRKRKDVLNGLVATDITDSTEISNALRNYFRNAEAKKEVVTAVTGPVEISKALRNYLKKAEPKKSKKNSRRTSDQEETLGPNRSRLKKKNKVKKKPQQALPISNTPPKPLEVIPQNPKPVENVIVST